MKIVLISTYELGRQPFGLASPAAWLKAEGAKVTCLDLAIESLDQEAVASADLLAFYIPMHTATRLARPLVERARELNPLAHLCFYGLYAPMNETLLRRLGADTILGGEFEAGLVSLYRRLASNQHPDQQPEPKISLDRQQFLVPDRSSLPELAQYAHLQIGDDHRIVGYTEATRGCKHLCRHCPVVPVYNGRFRIVQKEIVLEDIRQQVKAGATHITFGDPDFFNGPGHALPIVKALHEAFPHLTYDVTIKIEHILKQAKHLPTLKETGCLFVTSAVEAIDEKTLEIYDKRHTREDFIQAVRLFKEVELTLNPTFVTFSPWTTLKNYIDLLTLIFELDLVENVAPIQWAIRLLIPDGSRLLELPFVRELIGPYDAEALYYPWRHPNPRVDQLYANVLELVQNNPRAPRHELFAQVWQLALRAYEASVSHQLTLPSGQGGKLKAPVPRLTEPWYC